MADDKVSQIEDMGFSRDDAIFALQVRQRKSSFSFIIANSFNRNRITMSDVQLITYSQAKLKRYDNNMMIQNKPSIHSV